ncbi:hypothetical protein [Corynebacterium freiburgense]|uniref:hypothetical protein n=1 Tax=Corynebacterium freiburgense TaxID=556548 RepID=UPI0004241055|nr:hypothetical protein [Corynebacterium freiburgense]WJZ02427.1 hypothetical protein CFREI_05660 [Corynebacterium freiburgense]
MKSIREFEVLPVSEDIHINRGKIDALCAVTTHLGHQTVVRLTPRQLVPVIGQVAQFFGGSIEPEKIVGITRIRAAGFPEWPILQYPEHTRNVLNLVSDLEWARRQIKANPNKVKKHFDALTADLGASVPQLIPPLLDELSRISGYANKQKLAKQFFQRARTAERVHSLPIDIEHHATVLKEFADLGILTSKELQAEVKDASKYTGEPADIFAFLLDIHARYVEAGNPPYAYLVRDMRKLGESAGLKQDVIDTKIMDALLHLQATKNAPHKFWEALRHTLPEYLQNNPEIAEELFFAKPQNFNIKKYFSTFTAIGLLDRVRNDRTLYCQWLEKVLGNLRADEYIQGTSLLLSELQNASSQLTGATIMVDFGNMPPSILDALCEYGVEIRSLHNHRWMSRIRWDLWLSEEPKEFRRDLSYIAKNSELSERFAEELNHWEIKTYCDVIYNNSGALELLKRKIATYISQLEQAFGSVAETQKVLNLVSELALPELPNMVGDQIRRLFSFQAVPNFQQAVRSGLLFELTWPAFESEVSSLQSENNDDAVSVYESYPGAAIVCGNDISIVEGEKVVFRGSLPAGAYTVIGVQFVQNNVMLVYEPRTDWRIFTQWLGAVETKAFPFSSFPGDQFSLQVEDGRLTSDGLIVPGKLVHPGCRGTVLATNHKGIPAFTCGVNDGDLTRIWDGKNLAVFKGEALEILEKLGVFDMALDFSGIQNAEFIPDHSMIIPADKTTISSLLGQIDGVHLSAQFRNEDGTYFCVSPLGTFKTAKSGMFPLQRPGGGFWFVGQNANLYDSDTENVLVVRAESLGESAVLAQLPVSAWHQLRPRSVAASVAMRNYSAEQANAVIDAVENGDKELAQGIIEQQLPGADSVLCKAVLALAESMHELAVEFSRCANLTGQTIKAIELPEFSLEALALLYNFHPNFSYPHVSLLNRLVDLLSEFCSTGGVSTQYFDFFEEVPWLKLVGRERYIIGILGAPLLGKLVGEKNVIELAKFFKDGTQKGIFCSDWRYLQVNLGQTNDKFDEFWPAETVIDGCLVIDQDWDDYDNEIRYVWGLKDKTTVDGFPVVPQDYCPLSADEFVACLDAIEAQVANRDLDLTAVETIVENTGLTSQAVKHVFGGILHGALSRGTQLSPEQRDVFGFTAEEAKGLCLEIDYRSDIIAKMLEAAVPEENAVSYILQGLDAQRVVEAWKQYGPSTTLRLSPAELVVFSKHFSHNLGNLLRNLEEDPFAFLREHSHACSTLGGCIAVLLLAAESEECTAARREYIVQKLLKLRDALEHSLQTDGELRGYLSDIEFGAAYDDKRFEWYTYSTSNDALRPLLEGYLDVLIDDLKHNKPVEGCLWDPMVSAPEVVEEVCSQLKLSAQAARYYLQLLSLADPSDRNIRRWNSWKTSDIANASNELLDAGLIIEAKRQKAGRTRFVPGAWLSGGRNVTPMEAWKAPLYLLWKDTQVRPMYAGTPLLVPHGVLFREVWDRIIAGDVPGYQELTTEQYRTRRR